MTISEKDYLNISKKLLNRADQDGIERKIIKLIIRQNGVLMLKRAKGESFPDLYELPGGGLHKDENIFSGAKRELYEETGLSIQEFISEPEIIDFNTVSSNEKCRGYILNVLPNKTDIILNPAEHSEYRWVLSSEVNNLFMFPEIKILIKKILLNN